MSDTKSYAQLSVLTVTGRIYHAEVVERNGSKFMSVSVIHTPEDDGQPILFTFTNSNGLMALHEKGYFGKGREVTITGKLISIAETYEKDGECHFLATPKVHLKEVTVLKGGLGRMPKDAQAQGANKRSMRIVAPKGKEAPVDQAPELSEAEKVVDF